MYVILFLRVLAKKYVVHFRAVSWAPTTANNGTGKQMTFLIGNGSKQHLWYCRKTEQLAHMVLATKLGQAAIHLGQVGRFTKTNSERDVQLPSLCRRPVHFG